MTHTSSTLRNPGRRRTIVTFAAASLVAVLSGAAILAANGLPIGSWARNPLAWLVGVVLAAALMRARSSLTLGRTFMILAAVAIAGSFLAPAQSGVHRWIDAGPLHVNVAALLLPAGIVALGVCGIWSRLGLFFAAGISALLVLQPDASQATSFLVAVIILFATSSAPRTARFAACAAAVVVAAISWTRPDPLEPVAEVEGIFALGLSVAPILAAVAAVGLLVASLAPLAVRSAASGAHRSAALALSGYFVSVAICPAFGAFPVPLVGLGMGFPVGYWLGIALLCAREES